MIAAPDRCALMRFDHKMKVCALANGKTLILRREESADHRKVEELTREAFWNVNVPGCDEHYLIHLLRQSPVFIPELDWVAELDGSLVGNIMYSHALIKCDNGGDKSVITFGPVSVLPQYQGQGIGSILIRHTLLSAAKMGFMAVITYGEPDYYSRFGLVAAEIYGVRTHEGMFHPALIGVELQSGALNGISGRFILAGVFDLCPAKVDAFDCSFPPKTKEVTPSQLRYIELNGLQHP